MKIVRTLSLRESPDRVLATLCGEGLNVELEEKREGVVSTTYTPIFKSETSEKFEMRTVEYHRTKFGRLDKGKKAHTVTRCEANPKRKTLSWVYDGGEGMGKRFKLSGVYKVTPQGEGSLLSHEVTVEVDIPLIGGQIAKLMAKELDDTLPLLAAALDHHMV